MRSDSTIISFIENFPVSASLKEADTGRYIVNNAHNSRQFGVNNPKDIIGFTIQDLKFHRADWGLIYARSIEKLDFLACKQKAPVTGRSHFLDSCGDAQMEEMTKFPMLGAQGDILGIVTYRHDVTRTLPPISVYQLYRSFYDIPTAIEKSSAFLKISQHFSVLPTDTQFRVFLLKSERYTSKEISKFLGISDRTVESHCVALRSKIVDRNLPHVLSIMKRSISCDENLTQF